MDAILRQQMADPDIADGGAAGGGASSNLRASSHDSPGVRPSRLTLGALTDSTFGASSKAKTPSVGTRGKNRIEYRDGKIHIFA
jgi:hypothetical protein